MRAAFLMKSFPIIRDLETVMDAIPVPIFVKDLSQRLILLNDAACSYFNLDREQATGRSETELWPEFAQSFKESDDRALASGEDECEQQFTDNTGLNHTVVTRKRVIQLTNGDKLIVAVVSDVTAYREAEAHSRYLAFHDSLTGLPNRALFNERLEQLILRPVREAGHSALLYIDLDRFKEVNDTHGHLAGDALVRDFAGRLTTLVRSTDTVARLGGDEFAILLADIADPRQVEEVCRRILNAASQPFDVIGAQAFVSASIGVVMMPPGDLSRVELQRQADLALYRAKNAGRARFRIFNEAMDENIRERRKIEADLRNALQRGEGLGVVYQPIVALDSDRVVSFEALVRWQHPQLGPLLPAQFIPVAEDTGLIDMLGDWVLTQACQTIAPYPELSVAVNLSAIQLRDPGLTDRVIAIAAKAGLATSRLQLEITESAVLNTETDVTETLQSLRDAGVSIALDDFGTGYSSLSHLREFKVDKVKIDRSFIQHLGQMADSEAIVQAVTTIGRALGIQVTAEGVETTEQRDFLQSSGCDELQGYWVARPLPADEICTFMEEFAEEAGSA